MVRNPPLSRQRWEQLVRDLLEEGITISEAARRYDVSPQAVSQYLKRNKPYAYAEYWARKKRRRNPDERLRRLERAARAGDTDSARELIRALARSRQPARVYEAMELLPQEEWDWAASEYWSARGIHDPHWWFVETPGPEGSFAVWSATSEEAERKLRERGVDAPIRHGPIWMDKDKLQYFAPENVVRNPDESLPGPPGGLTHLQFSIFDIVVNGETPMTAEALADLLGTSVGAVTRAANALWMDRKLITPLNMPLRGGYVQHWVSTALLKQQRKDRFDQEGRRNPDESLRRLQRRAATGDLDAAAKLLRERVRVGDLPKENLEAAAFLGDPAAVLATGREKESSSPPRTRPSSLAERNAHWRWVPGMAVRCALAASEAAMRVFATSPRRRGFPIAWPGDPDAVYMTVRELLEQPGSVTSMSDAEGLWYEWADAAREIQEVAEPNAWYGWDNLAWSVAFLAESVSDPSEASVSLDSAESALIDLHSIRVPSPHGGLPGPVAVSMARLTARREIEAAVRRDVVPWLLGTQ